MQPFTTFEGIVAPLLRDNINTDQITPAQPTRNLYPDYAAAWFSRWRLDTSGKEIADFVLNRPEYRAASILVVGHNFGCGSAREGAAWAMVARGIRCIIGRGFAEFYRANCIQNGVLPIVLASNDAEKFATLVERVAGKAKFCIDLGAQTIAAPDGDVFHFDISAADRMMLLEGWDDIDLSLKHADAIDRWERHIAAREPWLQTPPQSPNDVER